MPLLQLLQFLSGLFQLRGLIRIGGDQLLHDGLRVHRCKQLPLFFQIPLSRIVEDSHDLARLQAVHRTRTVGRAIAKGLAVEEVCDTMTGQPSSTGFCRGMRQR